ADGRALDIIVIDEVLADQHVHDPERERGVGARTDRHPLVGRAGGSRADWINDNHASPGFARAHDDRPKVHVAAQRIAAPQPDQPGVLEVEGVGADRAAERIEQPLLARARADRDRKSTRLNSSHVKISYAVFCLKKKKAWTYQDKYASV